MISEFPDVELADQDGLLAAGGDLEVESLKLAYSLGIFPWPMGKLELLWWAPPRRSVLFLDEFRIPRRLQRTWKNSNFDFKINHDFEAVIGNCASVSRKGQRGTWITANMKNAYIDFYNAGYCFSVECYDRETQELLAGIYGPTIGQMVAGESMFHKRTDTSKLCIIHLVSFLASHGVKWIDFQVHRTDLVVSPLLKSFGAREVDRKKFSKLLATSVNSKVPIAFPR